MIQTERINDREEAIRAALDDLKANLWTALPGIVQSFDPVKLTVVVQPAIQAKVRDKDGNTPWVSLPLLLDCPVHFVSGGSFVVTFPIQAGDECFVIFASRCIDAWWDLSGVQVQAEFRTHDLSDGFAFVGPFSKPKAANIPTVSTTNAQLRTKDGTAYIELTAAGRVNIVAPAGVHVTGTIDASQEITALGTHTVSAHRHGGVQAGGSLTNTPTG